MNVYSDFGSKIVPIKTILKPTLALLEDRDKTVRDETKRLLVEIYRWIGAALKPQLANLKPVLVSYAYIQILLIFIHVIAWRIFCKIKLLPSVLQLLSENNTVLLIKAFIHLQKSCMVLC